MQPSISLIAEILSLVFAILFLKRERNSSLFYFIPFLLLTVTVELCGRLLDVSVQSKYAMYNIFTTGEFCFYSFVFSRNLHKKTFRSFSFYFIPVIILVSALNIIFLQGLNKTFNTYTFLFGSFFILVFCCFFFYESVQPDQIDQQLAKQPFFWICNGLLIFYFGSVIINALFEYLVINELKTLGNHIYSLINRSLNVVLYSSFSIAFYLCRRNKKIYSSPL